MTPGSLYRITELADKPTASIIIGDDTDDAVNTFRRNSYMYLLEQCFSTAGPQPGTGPWHQLYRGARDSPGICHF